FYQVTETLGAPGLGLETVDYDSAKLFWKKRPAQAGLQLQYRVAGAPAWMDAQVLSHDEWVVTLDSLTELSDYEVRARASNGGAASEWGPTLAFRTKMKPPSV